MNCFKMLIVISRMAIRMNFKNYSKKMFLLPVSLCGFLTLTPNSFPVPSSA